MDERIALAVILICAAAVAAAFLLMRRRVIKITERVEKTIEDMLAGIYNDDADICGDTLTAKLNSRLKLLHEMMVREREENGKQRRNIQQLISDISHQAKTPIANIKMLNETLAARELPPGKRSGLQAQMEEQIDKLDFLIRSMLKASRLETGIVGIAPEGGSVKETLALALSGIVMPAEDKSISIAVDCGDDIYALHDKKWTAEAIFNILDNAVKYTPEGGRIYIACEQWELYTKIDISDTGMGIPEEEAAQVFTRFYRSPSVRDKDGLGIGLYITREIIQKQGGYIKITSAPGGGSIFSVFLPHA